MYKLNRELLCIVFDAEFQILPFKVKIFKDFGPQYLPLLIISLGQTYALLYIVCGCLHHVSCIVNEILFASISKFFIIIVLLNSCNHVVYVLFSGILFHSLVDLGDSNVWLLWVCVLFQFMLFHFFEVLQTNQMMIKFSLCLVMVTKIIFLV